MDKNTKRKTLHSILIGREMLPALDNNFEKGDLVHQTKEGIKIWKVTYASRPIPQLRTTDEGELNRTDYIEQLPAFLLEPLRPRSGVGIIAAHQSNCEYHLGGDEPAGLRGDPGMFYGLELAQKGYVVLAPDAVPYGARFHNEQFGGRARGEEQFAHQRSVINGGTLMGRHVLDYMRAVDILQNIAGEKTGMIGHSFGGISTLFTAASDPRIKAGVVSCGFTSYDSIDNPGYLHGLAVTQSGNFRQEFVDMFGLLGLLDQQALYISAGAKDRSLPVEGARKMAALARTKYNSPVTLEVFDGDHAFPQEMRLRAYQFLELNLK